MLRGLVFWSIIFFVPEEIILAQNSALKDQREALFSKMNEVHKLSDEQQKKVQQIFESSPWMGQGNPKITVHPLTREQCRENATKSGVTFENKQYEKICGAKYMAPLYDSSKEKMEDAKSCIDQFEFPSIPCEYPVVWVQANEAAQLCAAIGKRLCDAHEWEGGCDGSLGPADYAFDRVKGRRLDIDAKDMQQIHNQKYGPQKKWAYGANEYEKGICAANSTKAEKCNGGDPQNCGSNTYPSGSFLKCKSPLDVYDQHGNTAEHMNLPLNPNQMSSNGSKELGVTEMKGSWFIFDKYYAHQDWCRWRATTWHMTKIMDPKSHGNYHLGFRCCNSLTQPTKP